MNREAPGEQQATPEPPRERHRKLGMGMCVALVVGNMIGSGAFLLPASLAPLGWNSVYAWLLTIGGTLCLAFVFSRLARDMAGGCGPFTYADAAFGPAVGFIIAWSYWISVWVTNAALSVAAVSNLSNIFPALAETPGVTAAACLLPIWVFTAINCLGVRRAGDVQLVTTLLKVVPLAGAIMVGAWLVLTGKADPAPLHSVPISAASVGTAATLTLFALLGFESALVAGDKIEDPERTVPRATLIGTAVTGLIYLLACSAVTLLIPSALVAKSSSPFALFFGTLVSPAVGAVVAIFVVISALGALNGYVLLQGELLLTLARQRLFPDWFARENRFGAPQRAHLFSSGLASILVLANYTRGLADLFTFMVLVTTSVCIIFYSAGTLSSFKLGLEGKVRSSPALRIVAGIALAYSAWTFYGAGTDASAWSLAMTAAGIPVYLFMRWERRGEAR